MLLVTKGIQMTQPVVFIGYDGKDEKEKDQLLSHLNLLHKAGLVDVWSEDRIGPGSDWQAEINRAITQARVAILLISANFLSSDFILSKIVPQLLKQRQQGKLIVFPVIAKPCAWSVFEWLTKMSVRPRTHKPVWSDAGSHADKELAAIAEEVADIVKGEEVDLVPPTGTAKPSNVQENSQGDRKITNQVGGIFTMTEQEQYVDFELYIAPNGYTTAQSNQGQVTATIATDIPDSIRSSVNSIENDETDQELLKRFGKELYDWLFPSPIHAHFQQTEAVARSANAKLRLRLRIEADSLASLPLEFAYRASGDYFLAQNPSTVFSRYLNLPLPPNRVRRREGPLHLLTIIANPSDQTPLNPDEWKNIIKQALAVPIESEQIKMQTVKRATFKEIRNALLQQKPDIIQFVGHGIYREGKGYLALVEDKTDETWLVDDERFANILLGFDDHLGLVSLATCESAKSDSPQGFLGIAPKIVQRGVPAVVAMQYAVLVKTAESFLENFYTSISARKPVDWAVQWARNAISIEMGTDNREFATPVLYMRAEDGEIF